MSRVKTVEGRAARPLQSAVCFVVGVCTPEKRGSVMVGVDQSVDSMLAGVVMQKPKDTLT